MSLLYTNISGCDRDVKTLYEHLLIRSVNQNISNKICPDYETHRHFVHNHPYRYWLLIYLDGDPIGNMYLSNENTIGIYLKDEHYRWYSEVLDYVKINYMPLPAVKSVRSDKWLINVNPANTRLISIMEATGSILVQLTYELKE